jgi:hypothetical protein
MNRDTAAAALHHAPRLEPATVAPNEHPAGSPRFLCLELESELHVLLVLKIAGELLLLGNVSGNLGGVPPHDFPPAAVKVHTRPCHRQNVGQTVERGAQLAAGRVAPGGQVREDSRLPRLDKERPQSQIGRYENRPLSCERKAQVVVVDRPQVLDPPLHQCE